MRKESVRHEKRVGRVARALEMLTVPEIMAKPAVSFEEICGVLDVPLSTMYGLAASNEGPTWFTLGRRRMVLMEDLKEWLHRMAAAEQQMGGLNPTTPKKRGPGRPRKNASRPPTPPAAD